MIHVSVCVPARQVSPETKERTTKAKSRGSDTFQRQDSRAVVDGNMQVVLIQSTASSSDQSPGTDHRNT